MTKKKSYNQKLLGISLLLVGSVLKGHASASTISPLETVPTSPESLEAPTLAPLLESSVSLEGQETIQSPAIAEGVKQTEQQQAPSAPQVYIGFSSLRHALLEAIAGSTKRLWLVTDYLTDGEIVTALYLAKYRKLDVKVLLGRRKAQFAMSRLSYLKDQKISVWLLPEKSSLPGPSALLADDSLLIVDSDLDSQARATKFQIVRSSSSQALEFTNAFATAAGQEIPAIPQALPRVGKANTGGATYDSKNTSYSRMMSDGSYRYGRAAEPKPAGVLDKLPKQTKMQGRDRPPALTPASPIP